jgi:hypothetical protein
MRIKSVVVGMLLLLASFLIGSVQAQSGLTDEQVDLVRFVETAYRDLTSNTYQVTGDFSAVQNLDANPVLDYFNDITLSLAWDFVVSPNRDALDDVQGVIDLSLDLQDSNGQQAQHVVYETVLLDGNSYTNLTSGLEGIRAGVWMQDPPLPEESIPRDLALTQPLLLYYLLNVETVIDVTEHEESVIHGETVRQFEVHLSIPALEAAGIITPTSIGANSNIALTATMDALGGARPDGTAEYVMLIAIGTEDGLPRAVQYVYTNDVEGVQGGTLHQQIQGNIVFSEFGASVTIENPLEGDVNAIDPALVARVENAYAALRRANYRVTGTVSGTQVVTADLSGGYRLETDLNVNYTSAVIPSRTGLDQVSSTFDVFLRSTENTSPPQVIDILYDYILDGSGGRSFSQLVDGQVEGGLTNVWQARNTVYTEPIPEDRVNSEPFNFLYLVDASLADSITALGEMTVEGIRTQAYELTLKTGILQTMGVLSRTGIGANTDFNMVSSVGDESFITSAQGEYQLVVYVGIETGLPHVVEFRYTNVVESSFENARAEQVIIGRVVYSDFGTGLSIQAPM